MECHKCEFDGKNDPRCIDCAMESPDIPLNHHGVSEVGLDAIAGTRFEPRAMPPEPPEEPPVHAPASAIVPAPGEVYVSPAAAELLAAFLDHMMDLSRVEFHAMTRRYQAMRSPDGRPTFDQIGAELGVSKQAVKFALGNVLRKVPEAGTLFPRMAQTFQPSQMRIEPSDPNAPTQQFLPLGFADGPGGFTEGGQSK